MQDLEERTITQPVAESRRPGLIVLLAIGVLALAAIVTWLLVRGDGEQTATDVIQDYVAAMRADDMDSVAGFDTDTAMGGFVEWHIGMNIEPRLTDCSEIVGASSTIVTCTISSGDNYFYSVIAGEEMTAVVSGSVDEEGVFTGTNWPPPTGLTSIDAEFKDWIKATHPEMESQMWGAPGFLGSR